MLEQEITSIIKFMLGHSGNPTSYCYDLPESYSVPAVYFPTPEIITRGETFRTYAMEFTWNIKYFHETEEKAYELALQTALAFKASRNFVFMIDEAGQPTGRGIRVNDPILKKPDDGPVQLTVSWTSRHPYETAQSTKMQDFQVSQWEKSRII